MLTLQEKVLFVKLFYHIQQNSVAAVKECCRIKRARRGPLSPCVLRKMIQKFETTGQLSINPGRGRKQIPSSRVKNVATEIFEASSQLQDGSNNTYRERTASVWHLKGSIRRYVLNIPADSLWPAVENIILRLQHLVEHERYHIEQLY
ncbi:uncharacterized protein NPIL_362581 [Nephila pilipes]|uniref:DUF4817 domain-containing protein n=1 Tax=Nephila pilipes TaxID=299642 RepID=A0A8X6P0R6_NEPPI|nr:uncharacterized protein NPIL_362581 [Nephila pilipes]